MSDSQPSLAEIEEDIAAVKDNLRQLVEQAAAQSGSADEELAAQRIADQEAELERLTKLRETLVKSKG